MNLTIEQKSIVESEGNIKINAIAGAGKTSTLIEYAKARKDKGRILYIAFNKSVKLEAEKKFLENGVYNVQIETAHSLAYSYIVKGSKYKVKKEGSYKNHEMVEMLSIAGSSQKHTQYVLATHITKYLTYFCNSKQPKVQDLDYQQVVYDFKAKQFVENFKDQLLQLTRLVLDKMNKGEIEIIHDFYLKKFQLECPKLPFDFILFDEGQDASEAMLDVFLKQDHATKIIVGDMHQQIYGWRYAINSLEKTDFKIYHLSNSFRFDNEIASFASRVLKWKNLIGDQGDVQINGYGTNSLTKTKATVARTNSSLLINAIELLIEKKQINTVYFEGRIESYTYADEGASIYDVLNLYQGNRFLIKDKLIASMENIEELEDYVAQTEDAQLALIVEVVKKYDQKLPEYIKKLKECHLEGNDKHKADMIFSTVHRCKGMEYDEVTLIYDFVTEDKIKKAIADYGTDKLNLPKIAEEINLLYVAITRTTNRLNIPVELLPSSKILPLITPKSPEKEPSKETTETKAYSVEEVRKNYNKAYVPWSKEEDNELIVMYCNHKTEEQMADHFGRTKGAIHSRIEKLDLASIKLQPISEPTTEKNQTTWVDKLIHLKNVFTN